MTLLVILFMYKQIFIGNEFTTLAGVEFLWTIGDTKHMPSDNESSNVLRFMTYEESEYERPVSVAMLDSIGKRGHIVLIEGVRTGTAKVKLYLCFIYTFIYF